MNEALKKEALANKAWYESAYCHKFRYVQDVSNDTTYIQCSICEKKWIEDKDLALRNL